MTRASSARRGVRVAAAAAGLAAALVLTGCSGGGDDPEAKESSAAPKASDSADGGGSQGSSGVATELQGNWLATTDGKAVALFVNGDEVAVFAGTSVCSGKVADEADMQMISLKCQDGSDARTEGMVDKVGSKALTITWEGDVGQETFRKAGGSLPSGLPTDLPTGLPSDLPTASAGS
ncbi:MULTISPECIES: hypothetical protein [Streptomyces]|uniref:Lipoprotein n=1 Tax=Streptomyces stelliscabiei TaxID=146820 RepID=A0A8I0P7T0_9ACTN|nr:MULTISPECIES: hypothetical protein [Streptomyces]KND28987.1 hypothetical protein IQ64_42710 [Streptomyces stelliscabiei]MBE1599112.1 hypothetical protein [Streptomyces stelliscabiei]MDX2520031.1 hypothetical protein [Streptomyces stelliscabiei]MDX2552858.1 hypothetical protein [Streptomyces stelliscabiei]MDX2613821.1 hypothetical protein [Streptomyces stelliscabiei]